MFPARYKPSSWVKRTVEDKNYSEIRLMKHQWGKFSMAAVKTKDRAEGYCQLESGLMGTQQLGPYGTFVGIFDGHGGPKAAEFAKNNLFAILKRSIANVTIMSADILDQSLLELDRKYQKEEKGELTAGAELCCLVAVIIVGRIYVANAGDARAVLGRVIRPRHVRSVLERWVRLTRHVQAIPLLADEHPILQFVRQDLEKPHSTNRSILHYNDKSWLAKGLIPTKRSIVDTYNLSSTSPIFHAPTLFQEELVSEDKFIIFGSPELWKYLSNEEAVHIVKKSSQSGIAMKLVKKALLYKERKKLSQNERSNEKNVFAVVLFLDYNMVSSGRCNHVSAISHEIKSPDEDSETDKFKGVKTE